MPPETNFMSKTVFALLLLLSSFIVCAQSNYSLNKEFEIPFKEKAGLVPSVKASENDSLLSGSNKVTNTLDFSNAPCFKPYLVPIFIQSSDKSHSLLYRKLKKESLFIIRDTTDKFHVRIDPLLNLEYGKDNAGIYTHALYINTRGFLIRGSIGKDFSFESSFYENQAFFPAYLDSFARATLIVPGQGRWKSFKQTPSYVGGFDYAMSSGYISYSPGKHVNIQAGTGKHFVGDGYRSLLLSDNAFNYPYLRITASFGPFQYTNLYTSFMNLTFSPAHIPAGTEHLYQKKSGSFQFLSVRITKKIQVGLFQALIAQAADDQNRQHLDFYYYNPIIGVSAVKYGFNDPNHVLAGSTIKINVCRYFSIYGQYLLDGIAETGTGGDVFNRQGFQAGMKFPDLFKIRNLHVQLEYNQVRPYTYASGYVSQSYTHYNQALADPLGANFKEAIAIFLYRYKDFFIELKYNHALLGIDTNGTNFGQNIFSPDYTATLTPSPIQILRGNKTSLDMVDLKIGYLINPSYNLNVIAGFVTRDFRNNLGSSKTNYIYIGLRTSLSNVYTDF
jgi:hypothetical protein